VSTALYRRYRSNTFGELIGQEHIATTLRNEVREDKLSHAYLFSGIRGTGKTSTARILARAVNCLNPGDGEPCNTCAACVEVLGGGSVDVLEIDAASNRGIDEMRDLREKVRYLPASLRRKVYIIDEAHMLTNEAWNAFLKTLEEPPPHVLFVLATTEVHKVPETVRSRVQRFDFRRVGMDDVVRHLASIAATENVEVEPAALELVARAGGGSVRDALSLLDQAMAGGARPVTVEVVGRALGLADPASMRELMSGLAAGDATRTLRAAARAFEGGADARPLLREAARLARAAELTAVGFPEGAELTGEEVQLCADLARVAPAGLWVDALQQFQEAEVNLRQPVDARLQVELCLLRLVHRARAGDVTPAALLARIEALESGAPRTTWAVAAPSERPVAPAPSRTQPTPPVAQAVVPAAPTPPAPAPTPVASEASAATQAPAQEQVAAAAPGSSAMAPPPAPPGSMPATTEAWMAIWPLVIDAVNRRDVPLAGVLRGCRIVEGTAGAVTIGAQHAFHLERISDRTKRPVLEAAVAEVAGAGCEVTTVFSGDEPPVKRAAGAEDGSEAVTRAVLEAFPGSRITGSRLRDPQDERNGGGPGQN
jgi:DNA polymerase-3 subunit gamma/tau